MIGSYSTSSTLLSNVLALHEMVNRRYITSIEFGVTWSEFVSYHLPSLCIPNHTLCQLWRLINLIEIVYDNTKLRGIIDRCNLFHVKFLLILTAISRKYILLMHHSFHLQCDKFAVGQISLAISFEFWEIKCWIRCSDGSNRTHSSAFWAERENKLKPATLYVAPYRQVRKIAGVNWINTPLHHGEPSNAWKFKYAHWLIQLVQLWISYPCA